LALAALCACDGQAPASRPTDGGGDAMDQTRFGDTGLRDTGPRDTRSDEAQRDAGPLTDGQGAELGVDLGLDDMTRMAPTVAA